MSFKEELVNTSNGARNRIKGSAVSKFVEELKNNMMRVAETGQDSGSFSFDKNRYKSLADILEINSSTYVESWLLKRALETDDFIGITIHISSDRMRICFSWK